MLCQRVKGLGNDGDGLQLVPGGGPACDSGGLERETDCWWHPSPGRARRCPTSTIKHSTIVPQISPSNNAFLFALLLLLPSSSSLSSSLSSSSWSWSSYVLGSSLMLLLVENRANPGHSEVLDCAAAGVRHIGVVDVCSQTRFDQSGGFTAEQLY
jgi:hypothetical protein